MKRLATIALLVALAIGAKGQEWTMELGTPCKDLSFRDKGRVEYTLYIGEGQQGYYLLMYDMRKDQYRLTLFDKEQHTLKASADLPRRKGAKKALADLYDISYLGGYANEESIDLLCSERSKEGFDVCHLRFDPASLQPKGTPDTLFHHPEWLLNYVKVGESPSHEWLSLVYVTAKQGEAKRKVCLYDTQLEEMWTMEYSIANMADYRVTDSGEVVMCEMQRNTRTLKPQVVFVVLDGESEKTYHCDVDQDSIMDINIMRFDDGKILCTGLIEGESQDKQRGWVSGYFSMAFDVREGKLTHFERHYLSKKDIVGLCNGNGRSPMRKLTTDGLGYVHHLTTQEGSTVVYGRSYRVLVDGVPVQYCSTGMMVLHTNTEGKIEWKSVVRREVQSDKANRRGINWRLMDYGGRVVMIYPELKRNERMKPGGQAVPTTLGSAGQALVALTFGADGTPRKQYMEIPSGTVCIGAPHPLDSHRCLMLMTTRNAGYFAMLKNN